MVNFRCNFFPIINFPLKKSKFFKLKKKKKQNLFHPGPYKAHTLKQNPKQIPLTDECVPKFLPMPLAEAENGDQQFWK
jgi:hypothetical protein